MIAEELVYSVCQLFWWEGGEVTSQGWLHLLRGNKNWVLKPLGDDNLKSWCASIYKFQGEPIPAEGEQNSPPPSPFPPNEALLVHVCK